MKKILNNRDFNPFPGLRPFTPEESDLFFGREAECDEIILKLLKNRYITVIGASGNGKSSLINGGVLPKMVRLKTRETSVWKVISLRPGNDPLENFATALSNGIKESGQKSIDRDILLADLLDNAANFSEIIGKYIIKHDENVVLFLDQFEELFRYHANGKSEISTETAKIFIDLLINSVAKSDKKIYIIVTMQSEYLGECSRYKGFTAFVNNSNYIVPDIASGNWKEIIEGPINYAGAIIDPELVEILLNDIRDHPDQLPVLQHALMRTWTQWRVLDEPDKPISRADYELVGTMNNAISNHADEIYGDLTVRGKEICAVLFKTISKKGSDNKGLRHPSDIKTIKSVALCSNEELIDVVEKFRRPSVSFITSSDNVFLSENSIIDLRHESLIVMWNRLKEWVNDEASSMEMYLRLSEASALYQKGKASLYKPPDLQLAIDWRNRCKPTLPWAVQYNPAFERAMVYLRTSEKAYFEEEQSRINLQKRKMMRNRLIARILSFAVLVASGFLLLTFAQKSITENKMKQAVKEKTIAGSFASIALEQKMISDSTAAVAVQDAEKARELKIISDNQKSLAERKAAEALHQKKLAVDQRNEAQRLRMLSIGKSMSLKSLQIAGQKDLQTLLAFQAYLFNKRNNGLENDADIYAGLYNVALQYGNINYRSYKGHNDEIKSIAFVPGKNEFFTSGNDGQVLKWSLDKMDQTLQVVYSGSDIIEVLAVSPDASWLACGSSNSSIKMIPLKGNNVGYEISGHRGEIKTLIFSYDGKYLYSAALDGKVLKWDIAAKTSINVTNGSMEISSIDISSKGNYLAGISSDGNVVVWNPERISDNFRIETAGKNIKVVRFNPENNLLALGDAEGNVELWDVDLHKKLSFVKAHDAQVNDIQFNTSLKQMATAGNDNKLKIFNIKDPTDLTELPVTFADNEGFVLVMQFSPDGQMIVSGGSGKGNNLISRPVHVDFLAQNICNLITRNMTQKEWNVYVGKDIPLEETCQIKNYNIKVEPIKSLSK